MREPGRDEEGVGRRAARAPRARALVRSGEATPRRLQRRPGFRGAAPPPVPTSGGPRHGTFRGARRSSPAGVVAGLGAALPALLRGPPHSPGRAGGGRRQPSGKRSGRGGPARPLCGARRAKPGGHRHRYRPPPGRPRGDGAHADAARERPLRARRHPAAPSLRVRLAVAPAPRYAARGAARLRRPALAALGRGSEQFRYSPGPGLPAGRGDARAAPAMAEPRRPARPGGRPSARDPVAPGADLLPGRRDRGRRARAPSASTPPATGPPRAAPMPCAAGSPDAACPCPTADSSGASGTK